jgi:2-C-methyl-D-erythritol 2,4-cyclodiphosphate synthase
MREIISVILKTSPDNISIKATTTEKLGFTGREEGVVALAIVLVIK